MTAVLAAAVPVLRKHLAAEIETANPKEGTYAPEWHTALRWAAALVRGDQGDQK